MSDPRRTNKYLGGCYSFLKHRGFDPDDVRFCCGACHEDEDDGFSIPTIETEDGWYGVCCTVLERNREDEEAG